MRIQTVTTLLSLTILLACTSSPHDDATLLATAKDEIDNGNLNSAIEKLDTLINRNLLNDSAYWWRGIAFSKAGEFTYAIEDFTHLIRLGGALKNNALRERGQMYFKLDELNKALADFDLAVKNDPEDYFSYYARGIIKTNRAIPGKNPDTSSLSISYIGDNEIYFDYNGALLDLNTALELKPDFVDAFVKRGKVYEHLNQNDSALIDYNRAIAIDQKHYDSFFARALLYKSLKNASKSLDDFNVAINLNPKNPFAYANRGGLKKELLNDKAGACEDFRQAKSLGLPMTEEDVNYCK